MAGFSSRRTSREKSRRKASGRPRKPSTSRHVNRWRSGLVRDGDRFRVLHEVPVATWRIVSAFPMVRGGRRDRGFPANRGISSDPPHQWRVAVRRELHVRFQTGGIIVPISPEKGPDRVRLDAMCRGHSVRCSEKGEHFARTLFGRMPTLLSRFTVSRSPRCRISSFRWRRGR